MWRETQPTKVEWIGEKKNNRVQFVKSGLPLRMSDCYESDDDSYYDYATGTRKKVCVLS
jgi:hypothetical protein